MAAMAMGPYRSFVARTPDACADCGRILRRGTWAWADTRRGLAPVCGRCASTDPAVLAAVPVVHGPALAANQRDLFDEPQP